MTENSKYKNKLILAYFINCLIILIMLWRVIAINNDKGPLVILVFYPVLFVINLILYGILRITKDEDYKIYLRQIQLLLILFIPVVVVAASV